MMITVAGIPISKGYLPHSSLRTLTALMKYMRFLMAIVLAEIYVSR